MVQQQSELMGQPLFLFGTLCYLPLLERVLGRSVTTKPASLKGGQVYWVDGQTYPVLQNEDGSAPGLILRDLSEDDLARLDYYEGAFGYVLTPCEVEADCGPEAALVYRKPTPQTSGELWSLEQWIAQYGAITLEAATEVMDGFSRVPVDRVAGQFQMIRARAHARVAARHAPSAPSVSGFSAADVELIEMRRAYTHFFSLIEMDLRHRRYDGSFTPPLDRAVFVATDVSIVLPYDPKRDAVLLIEQFRMGPYARGDRNPWTLEPIAGRIDAGETAEATAHREAQEEAGISLRELHLVSSSYPSPGASTEFFHSFVGLTELPEDVEGVNGLATEQEDIKSVVIPAEMLFEMARRDELSNSPLVMLTWWLAANRDRLRA